MEASPPALALHAGIRQRRVSSRYSLLMRAVDADTTLPAMLP